MNRKSRKKILYTILLIELIVIGYIFLRDFKIINSINLSKIIQIFIIIFLSFLSFFIIKNIRKKFLKNKYSYSIITLLGLLIFIIINIFRHIFLLIYNWNIFGQYEIYKNTLMSFSGFIIITLPCIVILSIYGIISNLVLVKKEGKKIRNILGILMGILVIIGLLVSQFIHLSLSSVEGKTVYTIKMIMEVFLNATLVYFYSILLATLYCNIKASKHVPKFDKDYIIILGCMVGKDGELTPLLKSRVDRAIKFASMQKQATGKDIIFIPSGGKGNDEVISEAEAIQKYLLSQEIKKKNILIEDKSKSTYENMKNSYKIIKEQEQGNICFSTSDYHVFRSGIIANTCGIDCEGMGSKTKWYFHANALIREFIANVVNDRKKHVLMLILIYLSAIILVMYGYFKNLIIFY